MIACALGFLQLFTLLYLRLLTFYLHPAKGKAQMTREHSFLNNQDANSQSFTFRNKRRQIRLCSACLPGHWVQYVFSLISPQNKYWVPDPVGWKHSQDASNYNLPANFEERAYSSSQMFRFLAWNLLFSLFLAFLFLSLVSWCSIRRLDFIVGPETMRNPGQTSEQRVQGETSSEG